MGLFALRLLLRSVACPLLGISSNRVSGLYMIWRVLGSDLLHEVALNGLPPGNGRWKKEKVSKKAKAFFASFSFSFFNCFVLLISLEMGKCFLFSFIQRKK